MLQGTFLKGHDWHVPYFVLQWLLIIQYLVTLSSFLSLFSFFKLNCHFPQEQESSYNTIWQTASLQNVKALYFLVFRFYYTVGHLYHQHINGLLFRSSSLWMWFTSMTSQDPIIVLRGCMMPWWRPLNLSPSTKVTYSRVARVVHVSSFATCLFCYPTLSSAACKTISTYPSPWQRSRQ